MGDRVHARPNEQSRSRLVDRVTLGLGLMAVVGAMIIAGPARADLEHKPTHLDPGGRPDDLAHTVQEGGIGFYTPPKPPGWSDDLGVGGEDSPDGLRQILGDFELPAPAIGHLPAPDDPVFTAVPPIRGDHGGAISLIPAPGALGVLGLGVLAALRRRRRA